MDKGTDKNLFGISLRLYDEMISIGHRGARGHAPENTLLSIQKALVLGAQCIEIDVYHIDGHLIVFHDDRLERTTNGRGSIEQNFVYLRSLDAGEGQRIPTLDEVMQTVNLQAGVNIELKGPDLAQPIVSFIDKIRTKGWEDNLILLSSFDHHELALVREMDERVKIGVLIDTSPEDGFSFALDVDAFSINPSAWITDKDLVEKAHANDLRVFVYTVNSSKDIIRMRDLGVDGVFSDYPEKVLEFQESQDIQIGWV